MPYITVYTPEGKKFEVASRDRADKLILENGWTQTPPAPAAKTTPPRRKKKAEKASFEGGESLEVSESLVVEEEEFYDTNL